MNNPELGRISGESPIRRAIFAGPAITRHSNFAEAGRIGMMRVEEVENNMDSIRAYAKARAHPHFQDLQDWLEAWERAREERAKGKNGSEKSLMAVAELLEPYIEPANSWRTEQAKKTS